MHIFFRLYVAAMKEVEQANAGTSAGREVLAF